MTEELDELLHSKLASAGGEKCADEGDEGSAKSSMITGEPEADVPIVGGRRSECEKVMSFGSTREVNSSSVGDVDVDVDGLPGLSSQSSAWS